MKMLKLLSGAALLAAALNLVGCASIAGDNNRTIHVDSKPAGAAIFVDNQQYGVTPATITLPTYIYGGKNVAVRKAGYQEQNRVVNTKFQPIALLDILFWPSIIIDGATGSLVKVDPATSSLNYNLQRA